MSIIVLHLVGQDAVSVKRFPSRKDAMSFSNSGFIPRDVEELISQSALAPTGAMVTLYNQLAETPVKRFADRTNAAQRLWALIEAKVPLTEGNEVPKKVNTENLSQRFAEQSAAADKARAEKATAAVAKKEEAAKLAAGKKEAAAAKKAEAEKAKADKSAAKTADKAKKDEARAAAKAAKGEGSGRGRSSSLTGHTLHHSVALDDQKQPVNPRRAGSNGHKSLQIIIDAGKPGISTEDFVKAGGRMVDLHWDIEKGNATSTAPKTA